jgi:hypothetical protein
MVSKEASKGKRVLSPASFLILCFERQDSLMRHTNAQVVLTAISVQIERQTALIEGLMRRVEVLEAAPKEPKATPKGSKATPKGSKSEPKVPGWIVEKAKRSKARKELAAAMRAKGIEITTTSWAKAKKEAGIA